MKPEVGNEFQYGFHDLLIFIIHGTKNIYKINKFLYSQRTSLKYKNKPQ